MEKQEEKEIRERNESRERERDEGMEANPISSSSRNNRLDVDSAFFLIESLGSHNRQSHATVSFVHEVDLDFWTGGGKEEWVRWMTPCQWLRQRSCHSFLVLVQVLT